MVGSQARILYSDCRGRVAIAVAFNAAVRDQTLAVRVALLSTVLTLSTPAVPNCCCSNGPAPYWSNPLFLIFDIRSLWRSVLSARATECQKLKTVG